MATNTILLGSTKAVQSIIELILVNDNMTRPRRTEIAHVEMLTANTLAHSFDKPTGNAACYTGTLSGHILQVHCDGGLLRPILAKE